MANMSWWRRPSSMSLRREVEDVLDEFDLPRDFRRELQRLFDEDPSPRTLWSEMDRLFEDFMSPPTLRRRMARLFEPVLGSRLGGGGRGAEGFAPQMDLVEQDDGYELRVDLPGVREQDVSVSVDDDRMLAISGERRREESRRERGYEYTERSHGSFSRSIQLPRTADVSKIEASFRDGVLEVHIPKAEASRAKQIPIRAGGPGGAGVSKEEPRVLEPGDGGRRDRDNKEKQPNAR